MQYRAIFLVLLITTAGCATNGPVTTSSESAQGITVTVTEVVDGDTVKIRYRDGTTNTVRLVGVDTPEAHVEVDPSEFEGVPSTSEGRACLETEAKDASSYAKQELRSKQVRLVFDELSDRRGNYGRLLAYVYVDGESFNYQLVANGYARVYDSEFTKAESFYAAEQRAMEKRIGVWRCRNVENATMTGEEGNETRIGLAVATIHADADGNDNENLNDEYVTFENTANSSLNLTGWTVADEASHTYTFSSLTLASGDRVTLYTGSGTDTRTERYWGADGAVWNNGGDTVVVRNASGQIVIRKEYT